MTQPFADALTWVPRSRALGATLGRAHDLTRAQGHAAVTLEHLLLALIEDPDASSVLLACSVDLYALNRAVSTHLQQQPAGAAEMPEAAPTLLTILEYAVAAARQSKRAEINGAIVLAAIVGEGKSEAASLLLASGLKFADAVEVLRRSSAQRPPSADPAPAPPHQEAASSGATRPAAEDVAAVNGHHGIDDDPVTTARRRIAAHRSGQPPPPPTPASPPSLPAAAAQAGDAWAPQPPPAQVTQLQRPPPMPPIAAPRLRSDGANALQPVHAEVPWSNGEDAAPGAIATSAPRLSSEWPGIDPAALVERIPERMQAGRPMTVEIRIPRGAVMATALASSGRASSARDTVLTRALAVSLRAPEGGFVIENTARETQWFDTRSTQRDEDEVRWRWLVTPQAKGNLPLQLAIAMRTVAADGMIVETALPEYQASVRIVANRRAWMRTWVSWLIAALVGATAAASVPGGWTALIARIVG